jgi:hypothetical protein
VYPNPVSDMLQLMSSTVIEQVNIYSLQGQKVFEQTNPGLSIYVEHLTPGVYILESLSAGKLQRTKLMKN